MEKGTPRNEKLKSIQENHPVKKKTSPSFPRASSHQPNMGNVLADMQRSSARFGGGPPKVTPRYPDDESSKGSNNSPGNASADARAKAIAAEEDRAKQRAEAERHERERIEQERIMAEQAAEAKWREQEERIEQERVAAEAEARRLQAEQLDMQRRQEEEAAAEEAARQAMMQQNQQVVEDVAPVRSHESEVDGPTGRGRETMNPSQRQSRREIMSARRERARSRHFRNSNSSPIKAASQSLAPQASPPLAAQPSKEDSKQETVSKPKVSASNASARASARDRYARHKKMMHQQQRSGAC